MHRWRIPGVWCFSWRGSEEFCQRQIAIPDKPPLIAQAQPDRGIGRGLIEGGIIGLCQINQRLVLPELGIAQFGMAIQPKWFDD